MRDLENGYLALDPSDDLTLDELRGHSITYRIALGPHTGRKAFTLQTLPSSGDDERSAARANGFSLHAGVVAAADQRAKLERLCRYITRPAVSTERLLLTVLGYVHYRLKTPYRDGTTHVVFEPTAHAVLKANANDGGYRSFILVESEDYADRVTAERVRRVINGYAYGGTQREELLREKVMRGKLRKSSELLEKVEAIKQREGFAERRNRSPDAIACSECTRVEGPQGPGIRARKVRGQPEAARPVLLSRYRTAVNRQDHAVAVARLLAACRT